MFAYLPRPTAQKDIRTTGIKTCPADNKRNKNTRQSLPDCAQIASFELGYFPLEVAAEMALMTSVYS